MNIRITHFYILVYCCILIVSCRQKDDISSEEALIEYKKLQALHTKITYQNDREAWLELSFQRRHLISKINTDHEFVLNFYHHSGYQFRIYELYRESLNMYKAFFDYYDTHEAEFSPEIKDTFRQSRTFDYRGAAVAYEKLGMLDSAFLEHQKNLTFIKETDNIFKPAAHNDFGMFLVGSLKDTTLALKEFNIAYKITSANYPEHDLIGSIRNNIGSIYLNQNNLEKAYELFNSNYFFYKKYLHTYPGYSYELKVLVSAAKVIEILRIQNKIKPLNAFYDDVNEFYRTSLIPFNNPKVKLLFLNIEMQYLLAYQEFKKSHQLLQTINMLTDSINLSESSSREKLQSKMNELTLYSIKSKYTLEKEQKEAVLLNQRLIIWLISIVSLGFLGVLTFEYYRRKQQIIIARNKQRITEQDLEIASFRNTQLNLEIESKKRDLSDFAINLTQNQEWAKILASKLDQLKATKGRERKKLMDEFEDEVLKKTTFDTNTKEFFERLDKLSDSFYSLLHSQFSDLSKTEKRLCSLIRLKIESNNIATIQNITLGSLNTSRYRLRKKMNLGKEDDLDSFIQSL